MSSRCKYLYYSKQSSNTYLIKTPANINNGYSSNMTQHCEDMRKLIQNNLGKKKKWKISIENGYREEKTKKSVQWNLNVNYLWWINKDLLHLAPQDVRAVSNVSVFLNHKLYTTIKLHILSLIQNMKSTHETTYYNWILSLLL